jgi:large subunit ribosomal protein L23
VNVEPTRLILGAVVTEKTERLKAEHNSYTFRVAVDANKIDVRRAVEKLFKVHVTDVRTLNQRGKVKRMGRFEGRRADWKKAIVTLKQGETIEALER